VSVVKRTVGEIHLGKISVGLNCEIKSIPVNVNGLSPTVSVHFICVFAGDISYDDRLHISHSSLVVKRNWWLILLFRMELF
jgi:hypothetical protein